MRGLLSALVALAVPFGAARAQDTPAEPLARVAALELSRQFDEASWRALLTHAQPEVRAAAARGLGRLQVPAAKEMLWKALGDQAVPVRVEVAFALGQTPEVAPARLIKALAKRRDPTVRRTLIEGVGKRGTPAEVGALLKLAKAGPAPERAAALVALALIARREDGPVAGLDATPVSAALGDADAAVRAAGAYLLMRAKGL
ncbi:MAG: HEAT repeat domain-containing protein, partial [Myxococcales bacterium]|nr:HEAT repeat domain-containing protein [Myxococcales bacterium]